MPRTPLSLRRQRRGYITLCSIESDGRKRSTTGIGPMTRAVNHYVFVHSVAVRLLKGERASAAYDLLSVSCVLAVLLHFLMQ